MGILKWHLHLWLWASALFLEMFRRRPLLPSSSFFCSKISFLLDHVLEHTSLLVYLLPILALSLPCSKNTLWSISDQVNIHSFLNRVLQTSLMRYKHSLYATGSQSRKKEFAKDGSVAQSHTINRFSTCNLNFDFFI